MSLLSKNDNQTAQMPERQIFESKFANARHNILVLLIFTVINIILLVTNSNTYFLFSAYVPYAFADLGMALCGLYPEEYYGEDLAGLMFLDKSFLTVMLAVAAVILLLYLLSWIFSKKGRAGWMIFALVFFAIDTLLMLALNGIEMSMAVDYVFHGWVLWSLFAGISAARKLKALPEEPVCPEPEIVDAEQSLPEV